MTRKHCHALLFHFSCYYQNYNFLKIPDLKRASELYISLTWGNVEEISESSKPYFKQ